MPSFATQSVSLLARQARFLRSALPRASSIPSRYTHNVVFVMGPPGTGKGTQCARLRQTLGLTHVSTGDLLRAELCQRPKSPLADAIESHVRAGTHVPSEVVTCLMAKYLDSVPDNSPCFLLDGFPRNSANLDAWNFNFATNTRLLFVLFLNCTPEESVANCLGRGQQRVDDKRDTVLRRLELYEKQTLPVVRHLDRLGLVREIHTGPYYDDEKVFTAVEDLFGAYHIGRTSTPLPMVSKKRPRSSNFRYAG